MKERIRFWQRAWFVCILSIVFVFVLYMRLPVDGSSGRFEQLSSGSGIQVHWLLEERSDGLAVDDIVLEMDGKTPQQLLQSLSAGSILDERQVEYLVQRDGNELQLSLPLSPLGLPNLVSKRYANLALALLFLALSIFFLWRSSRVKIYIYTAIFCLAAGILTMLDIFDLQPAMFFYIWLFWFAFCLKIAAQAILAGVMLHYAFLFPRPLDFFKHRPGPLLVLVYAAIPVSAFITLLFSHDMQQGLLRSEQVVIVVSLIELALALMLTIWHRLVSRDMLDNIRIAWCFYMLLIAAIVFFLLFNANVELGGHLLLPLQVMWSTLFFMAFIVASLVPRKSLLHIDSAVNLLLVYGSMLILLGGIFVILVRLNGWLFLASPRATNLVYLISGLITSLVAKWLLPQVQLMADRLFFRSKLSFQRVLPWIERQIARNIELDSLTPWLIKELPYHLQISGTSLLVLGSDEYEFFSADGSDYINLLASHSLPEYLRSNEKCLVRIINENDLETEARVYLQKNQVELSLPLVNNNVLIGILNFAGKVNGLPYTSREIGLLKEFGQHVADAVYNARVYREANTYNQSLEQQVRQRTAELAHAVHESEEERYTAERASRAKSVFLGSVSHQIRTPMNSVLGMADLMLNTSLSPDQFDYILSIQKNSETLLRMINDILDYSLIESGKLELERETFTVSSVIETVLDMMSTDVKQKNLDITYMLEAHTPLTVIGDSSRLKQMLFNVVERAIRYTDEGEIVIYVTSKSMEEPHQQQLHFSVKDTGYAIPPEIMETFFQPFQTVDAIPEEFGGTGLGLTISRLLSEAMGGKMWVEDNGLGGKGSTVHFTLVVEAEESTYPAYLGVEQPLLDGKKVLLVDGSKDQSKILTLLLQSWGMETVHRTNAEEALECLRSAGVGPESPQGDGKTPAVFKRESFDVAIIAYALRGMDGFALIREVRRFMNEEDLPILLLVPKDRVSSVDHNLSIARFIDEPYESEKLYDMLIELFIDEGYRIPLEPQKAGFDEHMAEYQPLDILVVEDNPTNKKLVMLFLEGLGYQADTADHGLEALELVQKRHYDVILMDVIMPGMDGMDTTRHIRKVLPEGKQPRIIAMTAEAMQGDRQKCLEAGMDDYISKPLRIWELIAVLSKCKKPGLSEVKESRQPGLEFELSNLQLTVPLSQMPQPGAVDIAGKNTLDESVLQQLRKTFGPRADTIISRLVKDFAHDAETIITEAHSLLEKKDSQSMIRAAHTLKSNSASLGAVILSELAIQLEQYAREQAWTEVSSHLADIDKEFERVIDAYRKAGYFDDETSL